MRYTLIPAGQTPDNGTRRNARCNTPRRKDNMTQKSTALCRGCGAVVTGGRRHCKTCIEELMQDVRAAGDLLREADVTLSRQDAVAAPTAGRKSAETPLPYNVGCSMAVTELRASIRAMAASPEVDENQVLRFKNARARVTEIIDIPNVSVFVGVCDCQTPLYARQGDATARCGQCQTEYAAEALPDVWAHLRAITGSVTRIRAWLVHLGITRSRAQLYRDIRKLEPVAVVEDTRVYRLADVLDRVHAQMTKKGA
jgi:hypothetical protein